RAKRVFDIARRDRLCHHRREDPAAFGVVLWRRGRGHKNFGLIARAQTHGKLCHKVLPALIAYVGYDARLPFAVLTLNVRLVLLVIVLRVGVGRLLHSRDELLFELIHRDAAFCGLETQESPFELILELAVSSIGNLAPQRGYPILHLSVYELAG